MMDENPYPEHQRMSAVAGQSQVIGEFLDWLPTIGVVLCEPWEESFYPSGRTTTSLLAEFFGIDLNKIETEKRAMLAALRERQET